MLMIISVHLTDGEILEFPSMRDFWARRMVRRMFKLGFCEHGSKFYPADRILKVLIETVEEREGRIKRREENPLKNFPPKG
jgi:hypothetical protein